MASVVLPGVVLATVTLRGTKALSPVCPTDAVGRTAVMFLIPEGNADWLMATEPFPCEFVITAVSLSATPTVVVASVVVVVVGSVVVGVVRGAGMRLR